MKTSKIQQIMIANTNLQDKAIQNKQMKQQVITIDNNIVIKLITTEELTREDLVNAINTLKNTLAI